MISSHHCSWLKPVSFSSYGPFFLEKKGQSSSSSSFSSGCIACSSSEKNQSQQHFEVDQDKAREALKKLDQQLQSLSQKQLRSPKIKVSDVKLTTRGEYEESQVEVVSEFSASFLAYTAGLLFLLTIFYNIVFITVIKPSIDLPDPPPTTSMQRDIMS